MIVVHDDCGLTGQLEREVKRCEQDGEEDPPSEGAHDKAASTCSDEQGLGGRYVALSEVPVCASETAECGNQEEEDADEDEVSAEGANHVDKAEETHPNLEESYEDTARSALHFIVVERKSSLPKLALNSGFSAPVV